MLRLTSLLGIEVRRGATPLGRLVDLGAVDGDSHPTIGSAWAHSHRRESAGIGLAAGFEITEDALVVNEDATEATTAKAGLLLARHVLDVQLVDSEERRLVRVGEVLLDEVDGLRLAGVETGAGPVLRRLGLEVLASRTRPEAIDWADLRFTPTRADTLKLAAPAYAIRHLPVEVIGARPGRWFGRIMRARRHAPQ